MKLSTEQHAKLQERVTAQGTLGLGVRFALTVYLRMKNRNWCFEAAMEEAEKGAAR